MMREPLLKVYGHVYPISDAFYADLDAACADALADDEDEPVLCREGNMARVSFEGVYFPWTRCWRPWPGICGRNTRASWTCWIWKTGGSPAICSTRGGSAAVPRR